MDIYKIRTSHILIAIFAVILTANLGTQFWADDFCRVMPNTNEIFSDSIKRAYGEYFNWTGRFTVTALTYLAVNISFHYSPILFDIANTFVFLLLLLGIFRISEGRTPIRSDGFSLFFLFFILWFGPTSIGEVAFWKTGAVGYLWVVTAGIWLITPYADLVLRNQVFNYSFKKLIISIFLIALCGLGLENYTATILISQLCALAYAIHQGYRLKNISFLITLSVITATALLLLGLSPGNFARTSAISKHIGDTTSFINKIIPFTKAFLAVYANNWLTYFFIYLYWKENNTTHRRNALIFAGLSVISLYILIAAPGFQTGSRRNFASESLLIIGTFILLNRSLTSQLFFTPPFRRMFLISATVLITSIIMLIYFNYQNQEIERTRNTILATAMTSGENKITYPPLDIAWLMYNRKNKSQIAERIFFFSDIEGDDGQCYKQAHQISGLSLDIIKK